MSTLVTPVNHATLVYTSRAVVDVNAKMVSALADQAALSNAEIGLTGMLIYGGGRFLQVLEGPRHKLTTLYGKIMRDPRHVDCTTLLEEADAQRRFPSFHMGHLTLGAPSKSDLESWDEICRNAGQAKDTPQCSTDPVLTLLSEFVDRFGNARQHTACAGADQSPGSVFSAE